MSTNIAPRGAIEPSMAIRIGPISIEFDITHGSGSVDSDNPVQRLDLDAFLELVGVDRQVGM